MVKKKGDKKKFDPDRRSLLKYFAKVGASSILGGVVGGAIGKTYEYARDAARYGIDLFNDEVVEPVRKFRDKVGMKERTKTKLRNFLKGYRWGEGPELEKDNVREIENSDYQQKSGEEKVSRRSFLKRTLSLPFRLFHNYPTPTGAVAGVGYKAASQTLKSGAQYREEKERYDIKQRIDDLNEKVDIIIKNLPGEDQKSQLEEIVKEAEGFTLTSFIGLAGLIFFVLTNTQSLTGFSILENISIRDNFVNLSLFFISLLLLGIGIKNSKR